MESFFNEMQFLIHLLSILLVKRLWFLKIGMFNILKPTYLLPVIHAQAASKLHELGYEVYWDDGNAQLKSYDQWFEDLIKESPDIIVLESTTPVIKFVWKTVNKIKEKLGSIIVMTGYHSMKKPEETLMNSKTDIVLKSNHIDFALVNLVAHI